MNSGKAQVFMFDLLLSFTILIVSIGVILSFFIFTSQDTGLYELNSQINNGFTRTSINDLNSEEIRQFFIEGRVRNIENTVAQQVSEFYYLGNVSLAQNLTGIYVEDFLSRQQNLRITIRFWNETDETQLLEVLNRNISFSEASQRSVSQRLVFGFINATDSYGPYIMEISLWQ